MIKIINDLLKELREKKGLSRQQVADSLSVSKRTLESYEYGSREPNIEMINKLADFYGVTTDYLLGRPGAPPPVDPIEELKRLKLFSKVEETIIEKYAKLSEDSRDVFREFMYSIADGIVKPAEFLKSVERERAMHEKKRASKERCYELMNKSGADMTDDEIEELAEGLSGEFAEELKRELREEKEAKAKLSASQKPGLEDGQKKGA